MNKLYALFWVALAGLMLSPGAASAASLTVAMQQVNPNSAVQTVTCTLMQSGCVLPFVINAGQPTAQSMNINVIYFAGGVALDFQTPHGYFYSSGTIGNTVVYHTLWDGALQGSAPATYTVALFQPLAPRLLAPVSMGAGQTSVATLQVTATPGP